MESNNTAMCNGLSSGASTGNITVTPITSADDKLKAMEADRQRFIEQVRIKLSAKDKEMQNVIDENVAFKQKIIDLETLLQQQKVAKLQNVPLPSISNLLKTGGEEEEMLTQAKTLLFEKTKICKQQELQIEALKNQVIATKDVLDVTKDMLNLRNMENNHFQTRFDTMDQRLKAERDGRQLLEKKLLTSNKMYADLKKEHDLQSGIFKELRKNYEEKISVLTKKLQHLENKPTSTSIN